MRPFLAALLPCLAALLAGSAVQAAPEETKYEVTAPPPELNIPSFYKKYLSAHGLPIVASEKTNDYALKEVAYLVDLMLAKRPEVREAMIKSGSRMCIMAHNEFTTDLPDFARLGDVPMPEFPGISGKDYWDARARGLGGSEHDPLCSCAEENVLAFPGDPYAAECIVIHEFAHNIHLRGLVRVDPTFDKRLKETYRKAMEAGLWKGKYAATNHHEYFAEGVQSWFDNNRENDHDHNHVNTRVELLEYDPGLAAICREVFGDTELKYTKPTTRLTGHMAGYDPSKAPVFAWPERLQKAKEMIKTSARERDQKANGRKEQTIAGWTVNVSTVLLEKEPAATAKALEMLQKQLEDIIKTVPKAAVTELQKVPLWISPEYPNTPPRAEYHPDAGWLRSHRRNPAMARGVEFTNVRIFEAETRRMPCFALHELAHSYHDRVLGFGEPRILLAYDKAKAGGKYDSVERRDSEGRVSKGRAYAMTNHKEYFAECTEAFFGTNDFYPFTKEELKQQDPDMFALLETVWNPPAK
ncbi:MAG TPA: hypothetical protein VHM91_24025 [Verrucomicrobiales bacterium]|nr:hypothetical protein [Verrucomicrobiales bacterium]